MSHGIREHIRQPETWKRGLYILLFSLFYGIAEVVLFFIVLFQFLSKLLTGTINQRLRHLGLQIAAYIYQITCYLSFNSDRLVYPFNEWPHSPQPPDDKKTGSSDEVDRILEHSDQDDSYNGD